jgi:hypothetical protein
MVRIFSGGFHKVCCYQLRTYSSSDICLPEAARLGSATSRSIACSPQEAAITASQAIYLSSHTSSCQQGIQNREEALFKCEKSNKTSCQCTMAWEDSLTPSRMHLEEKFFRPFSSAPFSLSHMPLSPYLFPSLFQCWRQRCAGSPMELWYNGNGKAVICRVVPCDPIYFTAPQAASWNQRKV